MGDGYGATWSESSIRNQPWTQPQQCKPYMCVSHSEYYSLHAKLEIIKSNIKFNQSCMDQRWFASYMVAPHMHTINVCIVCMDVHACTRLFITHQLLHNNVANPLFNDMCEHTTSVSWGSWWNLSYAQLWCMNVSGINSGCLIMWIE